MEARHTPEWKNMIPRAINTISHLPEMQDQIEKTRTNLIPQFTQLEQDIANLSSLVESFRTQCYTRKKNILLTIEKVRQASKTIKEWIDLRLLYPIEADWKEIETFYKNIQSNNIDDSLQNKILLLKTKSDEALNRLHTAIREFPSGVLKFACETGRDVLHFEFLSIDIMPQDLKKGVDQLYETCIRSIRAYEKNIPNQLKIKKRSILPEVATPLPSVSSHYATSFSDHKSAQNLPKTITKAEPQSICCIL